MPRVPLAARIAPLRDPPAAAGTGGRTAPPAGRLDAVDAARGVALLAMAAYHLTWDLGFLRLIPVNAAMSGPGRVAAHLIAGTFLGLVGVGLVLASEGALRPRPFLLRLLRIAGAALAITGATALLFPDGFIFFGVLHCIAVSSVLALPFVLMPAAVGIPLAALGAGVTIAAPALVRAEALDGPALFFLGLGRTLPRTNDWVPLFPWFGVVLAGVALARLGLPARRHSLAVYLVHQPVLLGLLYGVLALTGPHPRAGLAEFRADFQGNCTRTGGEAEACRIAGRCIADVLRREGLWAIGAPLTVAQRARAQGFAQRCYQAAEGTADPP